MSEGKTRSLRTSFTEQVEERKGIDDAQEIADDGCTPADAGTVHIDDTQTEQQLPKGGDKAPSHTNILELGLSLKLSLHGLPP